MGVAENALPRERRLRKRAEFEFAYAQGSKRRGALFTLFVARTGRSGGRTGVAATRKLGSAVVRNRAKRLAREVLRHHRAKAGLDIVLVPRPAMLAAGRDRIRREFVTLLGAELAADTVAGRSPTASPGDSRSSR